MKTPLLSLLLLALPAQAGRRDAPPLPDADMMAYGPCPEMGVSGFQIELGYGKGNKAQALREAREDAHSKLLNQLTGEYSQMRRAAVEQRIVPWLEGEYEGRTACAAVAISSEYIDSFANDARQLEEDLTQLAGRITQRVPGQLLQISPPIWKQSGCVADVGGYIVGNLRNSIAANREGVTLVTPGESSVDAIVLRTALAPGPSGVVLEVGVREPGSPGEVPIEGVRFPLDLLNVAVEDEGQCFSEDAIGLTAGEKLGVDGLRVWVELDTLDGNLCEGERRSPHIRVNQAALVKLYSVDRSGNAWLIWPPPGAPDTEVRDALELPEMRVLSMPELGDERLVAVATPVGAPGHLSRSAPWSGFCQAGTLGPGIYGSGVAIGSKTYTVLPAGTQGCPWDDSLEQEVAATRRALSGAPVCR